MPRPGARPGSTPKRTGPPLPHVMQLRLSDSQRRYLLFLSARDDIGMGEIVRRILDRSLDGQPRVYAEGDELVPHAEGMTLRTVLGMVTEDAIADLAQQADRRAQA